MSVKMISPSEVQRVRASAGSKARLVDVRTPLEFSEVHATGAQLMPLQGLSDEVIRRAAFAEEPVYVICKSGARATKAAEQFEKAGVKQVFVVEGGTENWVAQGMPVERGRKVISLERQVRITVGSLVLIFSLLALLVDVRFAALPAFFGAGLTFAGITDWCGLGLLLARMPWNQGASCGKCG